MRFNFQGQTVGVSQQSSKIHRHKKSELDARFFQLKTRCQIMLGYRFSQYRLLQTTVLLNDGDLVKSGHHRRTKSSSNAS